MAVDYDLVIIGASKVGIYAAQKAALLQARVALVTQNIDLTLDCKAIGDRLNEVGHWNYHSLNHPICSVFEGVALPTAQQWANRLETLSPRKYYLSNLAALGVDVIVDRGEFCRSPKLAFQTAQRQLRAHNFVLTTGANFMTQNQQYDAQNYLTLDELWQTDLSNLGQDLIVVGGNPAALELAQTLARFEKRVTLIVQQSRILPEEDIEFALLLQAQLEAEGVEIYTNATIAQIKTIDGKKWLQAGDNALSADCIVFAERQQPNISDLNLAEAGVKRDRRKILVNSKLQTNNSQIYACGDVIGGYSLTNIAFYEANVILKNTLLVARYRVNYHTLPWAIFTRPNFARVGLTLERAKKQCGENLYVVREYFSDLEGARVAQSTTGMCQLLVRDNNEIIGCSLIGDRAAELITAIALMMQQRIKLDSNPMRGLTSLSLPTIHPSLSEIWQRTFDNFYQQKLQRHPRLQSRLRSWFS